MYGIFVGQNPDSSSSGSCFLTNSTLTFLGVLAGFTLGKGVELWVSICSSYFFFHAICVRILDIGTIHFYALV